MPVIGMYLSLKGECSNSYQNTLTQVSLLNITDCSLDNRNFITMRQNMTQVLEYNNIYKLYDTNIPQFNKKITSEDKISFGLRYAMYRDTLTCLYETLDTSKFFKIQSYDQTQLKIKEKIAISVYVFVSMESTFKIQKAIQTYLLAINCFIVFFNVCIIIFRVSKVFIEDKYYGHRCLYFEVYFSFCLDLITAIIGGTSFFILNQVVSFTNTVLDTNCMGNYEAGKLNSYSNDLYSTADQNLQIFCVMLMKIALILINIFYYIFVKKCRITAKRLWKLFYENIHEGDEDAAPPNKEEIEEDRKLILKKLFKIDGDEKANENENDEKIDSSRNKVILKNKTDNEIIGNEEFNLNNELKLNENNINNIKEFNTSNKDKIGSNYKKDHDKENEDDNKVDSKRNILSQDNKNGRKYNSKSINDDFIQYKNPNNNSKPSFYDINPEDEAAQGEFSKPK
jgi:hypothetical protein